MNIKLHVQVSRYFAELRVAPESDRFRVIFLVQRLQTSEDYLDQISKFKIHGFGEIRVDPDQGF